MSNSHRSRMRSNVLSWFTIIIVVMSALAWLPAAAQDATPEDGAGTGQPTVLPQDQTPQNDTGDGTTGNQQQTNDDPLPAPPFEVVSVVIDCDTAATSVVGTLTVANPQDNVVVELRLLAEGTLLRTKDLPLNVGQTQYPFDFTLQAGDSSVGGSVSVAARDKRSDVTPVASDPIAISAIDGGTVCGTVEPAQDPTQTPSPTATTPPATPSATTTSPASQSATTTPPATPTGSPTATATPSPTPTVTPSPAPTTSFATVTGTGGAGLRCRTEPVDGGIITVLAEGSRVETRGDAENGWYPVTCSDRDGWMSGDYLTVDPGTTDPDPDPDPDGGSGTVVNTGGAGLRCRTAPVSGGIITVLAEGETVNTRGDAQNGWFPVTCVGRAGWVSGDYFRVNADSSEEPTDPPTDGTGVFGTVVNTGSDSLRCRTSPVSGATITLLAPGTRAETRGDTENGWVPVTCAGRDGWVSAAYFQVDGDEEPEDPTPTDPPADGTGEYGTVVNTGGYNLRCRTTPVDGATITLIPFGTKVETRGDTENGWVPVKCAGRDGWVSAAYFQIEGEDKPDDPTPTDPDGAGKTVMVSGTGGAGLRCRTAPVSGSTIMVLPEGAQVKTRGSASNGWVPVTCGGQAGWVSAAYIFFGGSSGGSGTLWIDIDLGSQYMRAYRGSTVVMQTYVSTGRPGFTTPTGTFYINVKLPSQTMSGVLGGEYYYVPHVPWVMYFTNRGHAIHGAYWHNNFGNVMSHGCVNLPVSTAQWLYSVTPIGTRVQIHW